CRQACDTRDERPAQQRARTISSRRPSERHQSVINSLNTDFLGACSSGIGRAIMDDVVDDVASVLTNKRSAPSPFRSRPRRPDRCDRVALVLQGGGALGAYQAGVYQALHEADIEPDWVSGVSIGAINSAIIAGNPPNRRLRQLQAFWDKIT